MPNHPHEGEPEKPLDRLAVTAFGDYLASPFHFWARRIRRMDEVDPAKAEMDDFDFGNVCHLVLEMFGTDETARNWTDAEMIDDDLLETADRLPLEQWGKRPGLAVRIQFAAARERLRAVADVQARERELGWEIIHIEESLFDSYPLSRLAQFVASRTSRQNARPHFCRCPDRSPAFFMSSPASASPVGEKKRGSEHRFGRWFSWSWISLACTRWGRITRVMVAPQPHFGQ